jgi:hypothetical protein
LGQVKGTYIVILLHCQWFKDHELHIQCTGYSVRAQYSNKVMVEVRLGNIGWYELYTELAWGATYPHHVFARVLGWLSEKSGNLVINSPNPIEMWNTHDLLLPAWHQELQQWGNFSYMEVHSPLTNEIKNMKRNEHIHGMHRNIQWHNANIDKCPWIDETAQALLQM